MMKMMHHFVKRYVLALLPLMVVGWVGLLASCDGDQPESTDSHRTQYIMFNGADGCGAWQDGRAIKSTGRSASLTRDASTDIEAIMPEDIGVFAFGNGRNISYIFRNRRVYSYQGVDFSDRQFTWSHHPTSDWPYTEDPAEVASIQMPWERMKYRFFAYSPWYRTEDVKVTAENYTGFSTFTWNNVPGFSAYDFILSNEIHDIDNSNGTRQTDDLVVFNMRHILSRVRFFFSMSTAYRTIRQIKIDSLTVLTAGKVKSATFNFENDKWDETVNWSNAEYGDAPSVTLTNATAADYIVPTAFGTEAFNSVYVYPQKNFDELKMTINYTVYDAKGVATRSASVTNTVSISPAWNLQAGYYYDIKIYIAPAYLYVLSDNDQDFDGYVIIRDETNWATP